MASPIIHRLHDPNGPKVSRLRKRAIDDISTRIKRAMNESISAIAEFLDKNLVKTAQVNASAIGVNFDKVWHDLDSGALTYKDAETIFSGNTCPAEYLGLFVINRTKYFYEVDQSEINAVDQLIARIVNKWVMDGQGLWSPQWYLSQYVNPSFEAGASDSLQSLQNISTAQAVGREISTEVRGLDIQNLLMQPQYRRPIELLSSRTFNDMDNLSSQMINDLRFILAQSIADGISAKDASKRIQEKIWPEQGGYKFRAERIARTEINAAYRQAYLEVNDDMNENLFADGGFESKVMHLSALTATTRRSHSARHGRTYTADEQALWWAEDGNSINCLCSVTSVLVDKKTGEILQQALYQKAIKQGEAFFASK